MFYTIPLSHDFDYYADKIDQHIKEDFETKVPDYGEEAFKPLGFHFNRKGNTVKGIYRSKYSKLGVNALLPQSTHMNFVAKLSVNKKGENTLSVFWYPQLSQIFMILVSLAFPLLLVKNFMKAYIYVIFFTIMFLFSLGETIKLSVKMKKEFKEFFK